MEVEITNPDKILYEKNKITKKDIINYYIKVSKLILPHLRGRPLTLKRYPNGIEKVFFYQKNKSDYFPNWIKTKKIKKTQYVICNDLNTLIYLVNQAALEFHSWLSTDKNINFPDKMIFDFDPSNLNQGKYLVKGALALKEILGELGLKAYPLLTGSRGIHVVVPLKPERSFEEVRSFAKSVADLVAQLNPSKFTTEVRINKRKNRIFIDTYRNSRAQTAIVPYSLRAYEEVPIALPINWEEIKNFNSKKYNYFNISQRLGKNNAWKDFWKKGFSLSNAKKKLKDLRKLV